MDSSDPPLVRTGVSPDGVLVHWIDRSPAALPPVRGRDMQHAWDAARAAGLSARSGAVRGFRFERADGTVADLTLADRDARCWAGAVDATVGIGTSTGLSICMRLLALVDLLARVSWARDVLRFGRDGAALHPSLLRAAAVSPMTDEGRFEEATFCARLPCFVLSGAAEPTRDPDFPRDRLMRLTGATA